VSAAWPLGAFGLGVIVGVVAGRLHRRHWRRLTLIIETGDQLGRDEPDDG
jgi:hypothetical protein